MTVRRLGTPPLASPTYFVRISVPSGSSAYQLPFLLSSGTYVFDRPDTTSLAVQFYTSTTLAANVTSNLTRQYFSVSGDVQTLVFNISGTTTLNVYYFADADLRTASLTAATTPTNFLTSILTTGTYTPTSSGFYQIKCVGGGGGTSRTGSSQYGNGGAGSGYLAAGTYYLLGGLTYSVTIGDGGTSTPGGQTSFGSLISASGGGGATYTGDAPNGWSGGSGGGGGGGFIGTVGGAGGTNGGNGGNASGGTGQGGSNPDIPAGGGGANGTTTGGGPGLGGTYVGINGVGAGSGGNGGRTGLVATNATGRGCGGGGFWTNTAGGTTSGLAGMVIIYN